VLISGMQISLVKMTGIRRSPLDPQNRTFAVQKQMSALCQ
jgi:hypothetical protein